MRLIGVTGRAGSGKDSVWKILSEELGEPVERMAFADKLRESAMASLSLFEEQAESFKTAGEVVVYIDGMEAGTLSGREYLQLYGTEAHRDIFGDDFWINQVIDRIDRAVTVITDVRYNNEAEAIVKLGGQVWEVKRPGALIAESAHRSEQPISSRWITRVIRNDSDYGDLRYSVMKAWHACFVEQPTDEHQLSLDEELRHNFLKRKFLSEKAKLAAAELSQDPYEAPAKRRYPHPW